MAPSTNMRPERSDRPYNTRRKSLSLHSLGIHVPVTHAARAAAAANRASSNTSNPSTSAVSMVSPASHSKDEQSSSKRLKRAHLQEDNDARIEPLSKRRNSAATKYEDTPPPSPPASVQSIEMDDESTASKPIDMESINDEIVEAVIVQLQETGNRPHLVKELAAVLMQHLKIVQQSANPCAIISSRLATFLKRSGWSAQSPCPLAKELESVHPRRTYFYLTTCSHQPLPDPAQAATLSSLAHVRAVISPSLSSAASNSEDADIEDNLRRRELSPSPEVDLSSPEFDEMDDDMPSTPIGSFSMYGGFFPSANSHLNHLHSHNGRNSSRRAASPPLEKDEKEFTQTADGLQKRKLNGGDLLKANAPTEQAPTTTVADLERDESSLFGGTSSTSSALSVPTPMPFVSSPAIRPSSTFYPRKEYLPEVESWNKWDSLLEWDRSPENIELDELDGLLSDY